MNQIFQDVNGYKVTLSYKKHSFLKASRHVLVICRYNQGWLLTSHPLRGLEFPGGKIEQNETVEEAAKREVYEETGGIIQSLSFLGEYLVEDNKNGSFVKSILFADIKELKKKDHYEETNGPVVMNGDLDDKFEREDFSFIMKDGVVRSAIARAGEMNLYG